MAAAATTSTHKNLPIIIFFTTYTFLILNTTLALNSDGTYLLAFRYSILNDPLSTLSSWHYHDLNPCSWSGVTCATDTLRVTSLNLANSQLLGSIPPDLFLIENLQHLDLSNNFFNGTLPETLFNSSTLQFLSLANNEISGELAEKIVIPPQLMTLNLSDNALSGSLSASVWNSTSSNSNLSVVSLKGNYFSGSIPTGWNSIQILDLSSNLFNGTLPEIIGGGGERLLSYLNISNNKLTGEIPSRFASNFLENSTIDLSFNNLTGEIPESKVLVNQKIDSFIGNPNLCGKPLKDHPCLIPSTLSSDAPTNGTISPAIAVIPKTDSDTPDASLPDDDNKHRDGSSGGGLKPMTIVGITVADLAGIALLGGILLWLYQLRKKKQAGVQDQKKVSDKNINNNNNHNDVENQHQFSLQLSSPSPKPSSIISTSTLCCCPCIKGIRNIPDTTSESHTSDGGTTTTTENRTERDKRSRVGGGGGGGTLVMVDGETELELETLLKASAYILGASGGSIVYKAVLENGMTFAVRRLGDIGVERMKDFENQMRMIAKLKHPNLVKVRGFYWAKVEKLMICDYVSNGSLAASSSANYYKKVGAGSSAASPSPSHLPLEIRLKIAKGIAKALSYIHDKKFVHGNIKANNILLTPDMNPIITDLGLNWLINGTSTTTTTKGNSFGSKRSHDFTTTHDTTGSPYIGSCSSNLSPYQAPESLKNLKPNPKWDVYSFGIVLLELLTGKVCMEGEMGTPAAGMGGDRYWVLRVADVGIRAEIQGREEIMASVFKLGFSCVNLAPNKRPSMKEALQVIEKIPLSWCQ